MKVFELILIWFFVLVMVTVNILLFPIYAVVTLSRREK